MGAMLILNESEILAANDPAEMRMQMREALRRLSIGGAINFPRHVISLSGERALGFMPAHSDEILGYKAASVHVSNGTRNLNPHQGLVVLLDADSGQPKAILDACTITALRTAAVSAAATESLSRPDSKILGLIGAGRQALEHALALSHVRSFNKILVCSRTAKSAEKLIHQLKDRLSLELKAVDSPNEVLLQADVIVTCTSSRTPFCTSDLLPSGVHVNAIGACRPGYREFNLKNNLRLKIYMDSKPACLQEAWEISEGLARGELSEMNLTGEIGDLFAQNILGRTSPDDITFFKSVGLGIMDLFAADLLVRRSLDLGLGTRVHLGRHL